MTKITPFLKKYVLPNLPYAFIFWFACKLGEAYRLAFGRDFLQKLIHGMAELNKAMANPMPSFHSQDLLVSLVGTLVVYVIVWQKKKNAKKWRKEVLCCKGWQWITTYKQGGQYVCGTDGHRNLKGVHQMEINYTQVGDYLLPNLILSDGKEPLGCYGMMHKAYLRQHVLKQPATWKSQTKSFYQNWSTADCPQIRSLIFLRSKF